MKSILISLLICFTIYNLNATRCQGCPNDNGGGGSGSGGPAYDCDTMGTVIYVDISRTTNTGNGKTWATAKKYLHSALDIANNCTGISAIRVARGTYKPAITGTNRDLTFYIGNNITIEGGYPTGGGVANHVLNPTILDGELGTNINSYHIMIIYGQTNVTVKGFRFRGGFADGVGNMEIGDGIFADRNDGAAIYMRNNGSVKIQDCAIYNNVSNDKGGSIYDYASNPQCRNVVFSDNVAGVDGGAIYMQAGSVGDFINCTFVDNLYFSGGGGAIYNTVSTIINVFNSIIWDNTNSWNGGGVRNVEHSLLQDNNSLNGGDNLNNIYDHDPEFLNKNDLNGIDNIWFNEDDGLNVCDGSFIVNRGKNYSELYTLKDIAKNDRIFNSQIDIGAYEKQNLPNVNLNTVYSLEDSVTARVYSGKTTFANGCHIIAVFEPDTIINHKFTAIVKEVIGGIYTYNNVYYALKIYYFEKNPWGDFNGKITLLYKDLNFISFNSLPYSVLNLPSSANQNSKNNVRILKFPQPFSTYRPNLANEEPIIIDPVDSDIIYDPVADLWSVTFQNSGELGMFLVTTFNEYVFEETGDFSDDTKWLNNNKPLGNLPSFNKIKISQGVECIFDEPLILKPYSTLTAE